MWLSYVSYSYIEVKMGVELLFKIAGIGIVVAIMAQVLKQAGKDEIATLTTLAGLIIVLFMIVDMIGELFSTVQNIFVLY